MAHSNQIREFLLTAEGIELEDVYVGPEGVLTGSMRAAQEAREPAAALSRAAGDRARAARARAAAALEAQRGAPSSCSRESKRAEKREAEIAERRPPAEASAAGRPRKAGNERATQMTRQAAAATSGTCGLHRRADAEVARRAREPQAVCEEHLAGRYSRSRWWTSSRTRAWRRTTRSSPSRRWCASCPSRCAGSSATSRTPSARWSACRTQATREPRAQWTPDHPTISRKELATLRQRLEEAEDMRRAITRGEVDAFVVGPGGKPGCCCSPTPTSATASSSSECSRARSRRRRAADPVRQPALRRHAGRAARAALYRAARATSASATARPIAFLMLSARDSHVEVELSRRDGAGIRSRSRSPRSPTAMLRCWSPTCGRCSGLRWRSTRSTRSAGRSRS